MGLRFDPMGGGQFKEALKQIIEAESQPIKNLEQRKAREDQKLKLFQDFKGKFGAVDKALSEISTFKKLRELKVDLGDGSNVLGVTIDKDKAQPGTYTLEVQELAKRTSVMTNGFENPDDPVFGIGFVVMNSKSGENLEVFVDEEHSSLRGIADLINKEDSSPVRASVIKDASEPDEPWRMILTAKKDGTENNLTVPDFYFLDGTQDIYADFNQEAQNALINMDGFPIEVDSNDIVDFVPGVNLHLKQARPGQPVTLTISEDVQKVSGKMKGIVESLNTIFSFIVKQNQVDQSTDTRTTFAGDTGLQTIEYRLRNLMHEGFPVGNPQNDGFRIVTLNELGVEFDKGGNLTFKEDKFNKMLEKDYEGVAQVLSGEHGFGKQLTDVIRLYTAPGAGQLAMREQGLKARIKSIDDEIDRKAAALDKKTQSLTDKFSRLQGTLSNLQRQQQSLQASMPTGGGGNLVQQLLGG